MVRREELKGGEGVSGRAYGISEGVLRPDGGVGGDTRGLCG